uniref:Uncharacterized protein n=1 Tax=Arundo donax TaxID=35708 RepID=A0A0A9F3H3_ARUDO
MNGINSSRRTLPDYGSLPNMSADACVMPR